MRELCLEFKYASLLKQTQEEKIKVFQLTSRLTAGHQY